MTHVKEILAGLAVLIGVMTFLVGIIGGMIYTGHENNQKVQRMNQLCIAKGYAGWDDSYHDATRCVR